MRSHNKPDAPCGVFLRQPTHPCRAFRRAEHAILLLRVIILSLAPSMPKWISDAREVLEYRMANRYLTAEHLEAERRQQVRLLRPL